MRPIISRYFNPIKRIEMIEIHFDTPYSLCGPPRIQDGRHNLEMKNDGMWYIFSKYFNRNESIFGVLSISPTASGGGSRVKFNAVLATRAMPQKPK